MATIEIECKSCAGTGLYRGFAEPPGVAVVCLGCRGTGKATLNYTPFAGRVRRDDVMTVRQSRGALVATDVGPVGGSVEYEEFWEGKMP